MNIIKEALSKSQIEFIQPGIEAIKQKETVGFDKEDTIRFPLDSKAISIPIPVKLNEHLNTNGFEIPDSASYISGHAVRTRDRRILPIGKILSKTKATPDIVQSFVNDPHRAAKQTNDLHVVITKDPYHVAGMSTDRGWTSCMDLAKKGYNKGFINADIEHGTHVAYLVHANDKNIDNPIARIAIKPYQSPEGHVILRAESKMYGTGTPSFEENVNHFCETHFPMKHDVYHAHPDLFDDSDLPLKRLDKNKVDTIDFNHELKDVPSLMRSKSTRNEIFDNFHQLTLGEKHMVISHLNEHGASDKEAQIVIDTQPTHQMKLSHHIVFRNAVPIETQISMIDDPRKINVNGIRDNKNIHPEVAEAIMKHRMDTGTTRFSVMHVPPGVDKELTKQYIKKFPLSGSMYHNMKRKDLDGVIDSVLTFPAATVEDFKSGKHKMVMRGISSPEIIDHILKFDPKATPLIHIGSMNASQNSLYASLENVGGTSTLFDYTKIPASTSKEFYRDRYKQHLENMDLGKRKANQFFDIAEKDSDHETMNHVYEHIKEQYPLEVPEEAHYQNRIQKVKENK